MIKKNVSILFVLQFYTWMCTLQLLHTYFPFFMDAFGDKDDKATPSTWRKKVYLG